MKKYFLPALALLFSPISHAEQLAFDEASLKALQEMSQCMDKLEKNGTLKQLEKYQKQSEQIAALCKSNQRAKAQSLSQTLTQKYEKEPAVKAMQKCMDLGPASMRKINKNSIQDLKKMHVCDLQNEFNLPMR